MSQDRYAVIIFWSDEDEAFIASVSELPGCIAHGETRGKAIEQIEIAIENWIDTAQAIGREIPTPTQDWGAKVKELEEKARERLKVGIENAMPEMIEVLAKEIAKPGLNVYLRYSPERGIQSAIHNLEVDLQELLTESEKKAGSGDWRTGISPEKTPSRDVKPRKSKTQRK